MSVSTVLKNVATTIGEGPHWDPVSKVLWFVDIESGDVHRYDPSTGQDIKAHVGESSFFFCVWIYKSGHF